MDNTKWNHDYFLKELLKRNGEYSKGNFIVSSIYEKAKSVILVEDKYGLHKLSAERLLKSQPLSAKTAVNLKDYFYKYLNDKVENFSIKYENFINVYSKKGVFVCVISTKYGICEVSTQNLLKGVKPSIKSAINKTEYFVNQLYEKFGENIINYSNIEYKGALQNVFFETEFGMCKSTPNSLLSKNYKSIKIDSAVNKSEYITNIIKKERGDVYDLSKIEYIKNTEPIIIGCKIHKDFKVIPANFISSKSYRGCPKCGRESTTKYNIENPIGWSYSSWEKAGKISKYFDSYKVYILKCWNDEEQFYKIGRTFLTVERRFRSNKLPYNFKIEAIYISEDAKYICDLEKELKHKNRSNSYLPKIIFEGMYECFTNIEDISNYITLTRDRLNK